MHFSLLPSTISKIDVNARSAEQKKRQQTAEATNTLSKPSVSATTIPKVDGENSE